MANLVETPGWEPGIYQIETTDPVEGGPAGVTNTPPRQLANRTAHLKQLIEALDTGKQPLDATLTALAALALAADKLIYATGVDAVATTTLTAFGRSLIDDADAAAARATLGAATPGDIATAIANLVASSPATLDTLNELAAALGNDPNFATTMTAALGGKQPLDATLTALAALATVADRMIYATGADAFATTPLTAFARSLLDDADAATARATLGAATPADIATAVANLVASSPAALDTLNELAAALGNDANFAATMTAALGGKQPLDATLTALAALATVADRMIYATGADAFATTPLTAFARSLLDDADAATARATLGVSGSVGGAARGLALSASGTNATVNISAGAVALEAADTSVIVARDVALAINTAAAGANGLDAGGLAASTWYSVWVIWNGAAVAGLISLSATAPTLPGGYTHKARVGWIRTDASGNKFPLSFKQYGRRVQYAVAAGSNLTAPPTMASGISGTYTSGTYTGSAVAVANFVPSTAAKIALTLQAGTSGNAGAASPNANYTGYGGSSPPPIQTVAASNGIICISGEFLLESSNVYYAAAASANALQCTGWEDNL